MQDRRLQGCNVGGITLKPDAEIKRVVMCSGKVYHDLVDARAKADNQAALRRRVQLGVALTVPTLLVSMVPALHFIFDQTIEKAVEISRLIDAANASRRRRREAREPRRG